MDWDQHVTAMQAQWVLRWIQPPDRDECAWKHVLYYMVLVDNRGYEKFPEGRGIFMCRMTPADKLRLMRGVPKRAEYIESCIRSFWKVGISQDLEVTAYMRSETFWHNARFRVLGKGVNEEGVRMATPAERKYYSTILDVHTLGDLVDSQTNEARTLENWCEWVQGGGVPGESRRRCGA